MFISYNYTLFYIKLQIAILVIGSTLSLKAEEYENRKTLCKNMAGDNVIDIIPTNTQKLQFG